MAATMAKRFLTRNFLKSVKYSVPRKIITQQTRLCSYYPINDEFYGLTSEQQQVSYKLSFFKLIRVPTRTGKPGKMGRHFPVREKSGNFEQTGKVREKSGKTTQNTGKLR